MAEAHVPDHAPAAAGVEGVVDHAPAAAGLLANDLPPAWAPDPANPQPAGTMETHRVVPGCFVVIGHWSWTVPTKVCTKVPAHNSVMRQVRVLEKASEKDKVECMARMGFQWPLMACRVGEEMAKRRKEEPKRLRIAARAKAQAVARKTRAKAKAKAQAEARKAKAKAKAQTRTAKAKAKAQAEPTA